MIIILLAIYISGVAGTVLGFQGSSYLFSDREVFGISLLWPIHLVNLTILSIIAGIVVGVKMWRK